MRPAFMIALAMILGLAACADPRTACLDRAAEPLRSLDAEIAETETALALGYRIADGSRITAGMRLCADNSPVTFCVSGQRPISERRIAIDRASERARLEALIARRPAVAAAAARAVDACPAPAL